MAGVQSTLPFCIRKKAQFNFYSDKNDKTDKVDVTEKIEAVQKEIKTAPPKIKKLVELDSGDENIDLTNIPAKRPLKRKYVRSSSKKQLNYDSSDESDCSPTKKARPSSKAKSAKAHKKIDANNDLDESEKNQKTLPGRTKELDKLTNFLDNHLHEQNSGTLYISGQPGTGKTACLTNILERPQYKAGFTEVYINCTTMKSAGSIFNRICQELHIKSSANSEKAYLKAIDKHLAGKHNMILLVLDEIDQLTNKNQSVLYTIFEWPSRENSKIVLIGIANALDLTDRVLPRLQARSDLRPELMHFAPYTKEQIIEIFTERLKEDMTTDLFSPIAIQMLAGKVAAVSGDVRRALDIGKRVAELASPKTVYSARSKKPDAGCTVELKQVMNVLNDVYGTSQRLADDVDDSFPLQQKILICSLLLILTKGKNKDVSVGRLYDVYKRVCTKRNLVAVDSSEFFGLCSLVETRGILRLSGKKDARLQKVTLQWDESEVSHALKDKQMISDIMNDVSCL